MGRKVLGLEIGAKEFKIALVKNGRHPRLLYCELISAPALLANGLNDDDNEITIVVLAVKEVISKQAKLIKQVESLALSLNDRQTVVRHMTLPALPKRQQSSAIEYGLSQNFPGLGKTHCISFKEYTRTTKQVTGIAAFSPHKNLEVYRKLLQQLGFKNSYIDVLANCEAKAINAFLNIPKNETVLVCDIGPDSSHFSVISGKMLTHSRQIPWGQRTPEQIASKLDMIPSANIGQLYISDGKFKEVIPSVYSDIEEHLHQTIDFYNADTRGSAPISRILLTGSRSIYPGLSKYFSINLGIPVSPVNLPTGAGADAVAFAGSLSAIGAAIRED